jgi:tRNA dimethylallyltransferase
MANPSINELNSPSGLIVVGGATATGKTSLAIALATQLRARRMNSVILSADSRQVYREFNIGTAKPSLAERNGIPHYLIDICDPTHSFTVADYQKQAQALLHHGDTATSSEFTNCPSIPILVGGTGLYLNSVTKGLIIPQVPPQANLRSQLERLGQRQCYAMLQRIDPLSADKIHPNDRVRTVRSLEVFYVTGRPMSAQRGSNPPPYPILQIGLDCQTPEALQSRIEHRTQQMIAAGFAEEVAALCQKYGTTLPLLNTLGYAELKQHYLGNLSLTQAQALTVLHTRQFAKRQRTWFTADPTITWFDANSPNLETQVWEHVQRFLDEFAEWR